MTNIKIDKFLTIEINKFKKRGYKVDVIRMTPWALFHIRIPQDKDMKSLLKHKNIISVEVLMENNKDIRISTKDAWFKSKYYNYDSVEKFKKGFIRNISNKY